MSIYPRTSPFTIRSAHHPSATSHSQFNQNIPAFLAKIANFVEDRPDAMAAGAISTIFV